MKKFIACLACLVLITAGALHAQQGRGKIRGVVLDAGTGKPLPGVTVKMFMQSLNVYFQPSPVTDNEGKWSANFLRTGMWTLEFDKVGYAPQTVSWNIAYDAAARVESQRESVNVSLRPIKGLIIKDTIVAESKKADKLFQEKKYAEARALLEKLIADNPDTYILYKNLGNTYYAEENYEKAAEAYKKVYEKAPDRADVVAAIANAYNNMGDKPQAAEWYSKLSVGDVQDVDTAYNAGVSLYNAGNTAQAVEYFKKSVEIDPSFADGYYQLGMASVAQAKNEEAIDAFKKFLELAPDSPQAGTAKSIMEALTKK
jgi:tetratricopeptide (TPR) repeat protein